MDNKVLHTKIDSAECNGVKVEIKAEVFDQPIQKNEARQCFTRVLLIDKSNDDGNLWGPKIIYYERQNDQEGLDAIVAHIKKSLCNYKDQ